MQHIFLSPHLDDVVGCCGGTIAKLVYERQDVVVITAYTHCQDINAISRKFRKFADYEIRKKEDKVAMNKLSADYKWLDIEERAYRTPLLKKPNDVFKIDLSRGLKQFINIQELHNELDKIFGKNPKTKIYAPLGVGNHFDHVELFLASLIYMVDNALYDNFLFYLDMYGMVSTKIRSKHYLGKKFIPRGKKPEFSSLRSFLITTGMNIMMSGSSIEQLLSSKYLDIEWEIETVSIKGYEKLKINALESYKSQLAIFGRKTMIKFFRRHHANWESKELYLKVKEI